MKKNVLLVIILLGCITACQPGKKKEETMENQQETKLRIETTVGDITVKLYNETPKHRDNFIKLAKDSTYDGTLFHRVIKDFMIQAGDPDSKNAPAGAQLGMGDVGYRIPAEFVYPKYFHKKGVLSAARQGDQTNPKRESSGCQFYIVTGQVYDDAALLSMEQRMNQNKTGAIFQQLAGERMDEIRKMQAANDQKGLEKLQEELSEKAIKQAAKQPDVKFTPEQVKAYTTIGGTPHLDGQYTVFGEVVEGMNVVDSIQRVATNPSDRPLEDVVIKQVVLLQ